MNIRYTRRASRHLASIFDWIARDSPNSAAGQIARIQHLIGLLEQFPEMGHRGLSQGTLELVVPRTWYIVVYRIRAPDVQILAVFDGRRREVRR